MEASRGKLSAALDPRRRIQRDPFNEMFVLVLSAVGASTLLPVLLLAIGALTDQLDFIPFVAICVVGELVLIFGIGRPAMKPLERIGWAMLWGFAAAAFGAAFWELVYAPVL